MISKSPEFPEFTVEILQRIIAKNLPLCPDIQRIGLVGSYARNSQNKNSDVDLVIDTDDSQFRQMLAGFGMRLSEILDYRFNKHLEIVRYSLVVKRAAGEPEADNWYYRDGYKQMLDEVIWLYERPDNFRQNRELLGACAKIL